MFMKYHHFDKTPVKISDILWNSGEIRWNFDKILQNLQSLFKFSEKCIKFCKIGAKVPKNQRNLEWCEGKHVELEKRWKMRPWSQKSALIRPRTSLEKVLKMDTLKVPAGYSNWTSAGESCLTRFCCARKEWNGHVEKWERCWQAAT